MKRIALTLFVCLLSTSALPQTQPTYTAHLTWTAPVGCKAGSTPANCVVTGYRAERLQGSSWVDQRNYPASALTGDMPAFLGSNQYRLYALSADGGSDPSNPVTRVFDVPNAPVIIQITITVDTQGNVTVTQ